MTFCAPPIATVSPSCPAIRPVAAHFHFAYTVPAMEKGLEWTPPLKPVLKSMGCGRGYHRRFSWRQSPARPGTPRDLGDVRFKEVDLLSSCRARSGPNSLLIAERRANV